MQGQFFFWNICILKVFKVKLDLSIQNNCNCIPNLKVSLLLKGPSEFTVHRNTECELEGASRSWEWKDRRKSQELVHFRRITACRRGVSTGALVLPFPRGTFAVHGKLKSAEIHLMQSKYLHTSLAPTSFSYVQLAIQNHELDLSCPAPFRT